PFEQCGDAVGQTDVLSVGHRVLRHKYDFADPLLSQTPRFRYEIINGPAAKLSAKSRNGAERANVIASLGNLEIRHIGWRCQHSRNGRNFFRTVERIDRDIEYQGRRLVIDADRFKDSA